MKIYYVPPNRWNSNGLIGFLIPPEHFFMGMAHWSAYSTFNHIGTQNFKDPKWSIIEL